MSEVPEVELRNINVTAVSSPYCTYCNAEKELKLFTHCGYAHLKIQIFHTLVTITRTLNLYQLPSNETILSLRFGHKNISTTIVIVRLIQEGQ